MVDALDAVRAVIAADRGELMLPGVLSVRAGWKFRGGWPVDPPTPAIVVTVADKTSLPPGGQLLPAVVAGVAVDVRQASALKRQTLRERAAPAGAIDPPTGLLPQFPDEVTPAGTPVLSGQGVRAEALTSGVVGAAAVSKPQIPYSGPDGVSLAPVTGMLRVQACVSPDAGWPVLKAFLDSVQTSVTIGLYDWTSQHVLEAFTTALAGKSVRLVLDHPSRNPTADQSDEDTVSALKAALGQGLTQAWALERSDPLAAAWVYPSAYHIKVAVADHARVWLSSGNWNNSNQPDIDPVINPADAAAARSGDRDWHVVIDSPDLAAIFEAYLAHDLTLAQAHQRASAVAAPEIAAQAILPAAFAIADGRTPPFVQFWAPTTVTQSMTITPLLTPDPAGYASHVQTLIESATVSLYMQFQYIKLPTIAATAPAAFTALLAAVAARQQAGVDVRIIMSEFETQGSLEQLMSAGLDGNASVRIQNNVHNKCIIVDATTVLVSSQNWSGAGITANRDAGVILQNTALARYFHTIFAHDWDTLATAAAAED